LGHQAATPPRQAFVDRFRFNAKRAALVQSRIKAIERLADVETIADDPGAGWLWRVTWTCEGRPCLQLLHSATAA